MLVVTSTDQFWGSAKARKAGSIFIVQEGLLVLMMDNSMETWYGFNYD